MKIAIVDKCPSTIKYNKYFDFDFDLHHLSSVRVSKLLKKHIDLELKTEEYDYIILVGSEATKEFTKNASVTDHSGYLIEEKFIPLLNPSMLTFKPEAKPAFDKALEQIKKVLSGESLVDKSGEYLGILDEEEAYNYLLWCKEEAKKTKLVALDTETTGLYPRDGYVLGVSICVKERTAAYISADALSDRCLQVLQEIINDNLIIFHNSKFDIKMMEYHFGLKFVNFTDTLLIHYLLDETQGTHGLKQLAIKFTKFGDYDRELEVFKETYCKQHKILKEQFTYDLIPFDIISTYAAVDTAVTLELYNLFYPIILKNSKLHNVLNNLLVPGTSLLKDIEEFGIPIDKERLEFANITIAESIRQAEEELLSFDEVRELSEEQGSPFNPNSVQQLRVLLFDKLKLTPINKLTGTGLQSTDAEVLEDLEGQHPIVNAIITLRKLGKIKNTYVDKILVELDRDNRLRTGFNLTSTTSGRLSSSGKFNAQQISRDEMRIKGAIKGTGIYKDWKIISQDLATAEMYYASVLSGDKALQDVFISGGDFHSAIAKKVFKLPCKVEDVKELYPAERQAAKAISFGILYGSGPQKVSDTVTKSSGQLFTLSEAKEAINDYFSTFYKLKIWLKSTEDLIRAQGFLYTSFGRKRRLSNVFSPDAGIASHEVRSGINAAIQSLASDINLLAAIETHNTVQNLKLKAEIFMLVHDSIVAIVHPEDVETYCQILKKATQRDRGFSIPGVPIGIDQSIGEDYSFGKFDEQWGKQYAEFGEHSISNLPTK